tara:strand:- start:143 stop:1060 length:918 start_codon:yes stop_codon:yes gene_type:complete
MAKPNLLLLQVLTKNRNAIRDGVARIQDVVTDYFRSGGKDIQVSDRAIIEDFFVKEAPSNVTSMDIAEPLVDLAQNPKTPYSMANDLSKRNPGLKFTDDMTFGEANEVKQGIGSLPKGVPGEIFDAKNAARDEAATFIKAMRDKNISNTDIAGVRRVPGDEQKRTAELVVNQNRMGADTSIKQGFMEDFTELKNTKGPRFFKEEFLGYDSVGDMINNKGIEARNAIVDDLELLGVAENELMQIARSANEVAANNPFAPEAWITSIKQDLELNGINYDMRFWDNYFDQLIDSTRKDPSMFRYGGLV